MTDISKWYLHKTNSYRWWKRFLESDEDIVIRTAFGDNSRRFSPSKPRKCEDCHAYKYDVFANRDKKHQGCNLNFETEVFGSVQRPLLPCIKVPTNDSTAEDYLYQLIVQFALKSIAELEAKK